MWGDSAKVNAVLNTRRLKTPGKRHQAAASSAARHQTDNRQRRSSASDGDRTACMHGQARAIQTIRGYPGIDGYLSDALPSSLHHARPETAAAERRPLAAWQAGGGLATTSARLLRSSRRRLLQTVKYTPGN